MSNKTQQESERQPIVTSREIGAGNLHSSSDTQAPAQGSLFRSISSNIAGDGVNGIVSFILTPILIRGLGDYSYGIWALAYSVLSAYGLLDSGMRLTFQRFIAGTRGRHDEGERIQILSTVLLLTVSGSVLVCALTLVFVMFLPHFFSVPPESRQVFQTVLGLIGVSVAVALPTRVFGSFLTGLQRFDLYNLGAVTFLTLRAVLLIVAVKVGWGLIGMATISLCIEMLSVPCHWYLVRRADPAISLHWSHFRVAKMREMGAFSFYAYLSNFGDYLRFYTDSAVIGRMLTIALVTPFSAAGRIITLFKGVITSLSSPLLPRMTELDSHGESGQLRELYLRSTKLTVLISLFFGLVVLLDGKMLLRVWLGQRFVSSYSLLVILAAGSVVSFAQAPSMYLMFAKGRHKLKGWWTLGEGVANLVLSVYWARRFGILGVALGTTVPMLVTGLLIQPVYAVRLLHISFWDYLRNGWAGPVLSSGVFLGTWLAIVHFDLGSTVVGLALTVAVQFSLFSLCAYILAFGRTDREVIHCRFRSVMAKVG